MDRSGPRKIHPTRRATPRALTLLALVCSLARCGDATVTQLLVVVSTEPAEGLPIEAVEVEVQSEDTLTTWDSARFAVVGAAGGRFTLPLTFGVVPRSASPGRVRVTARARLREGAATRSLETSALTTFITGQKLLLPLVLDYRCSLPPPCLPGSACSPQGCVSELRPASTLRALGPDDAPPATGSTCARPAEACIDRCDEGSRAPVTRFVNRARRTTLTTTPATPPCCGEQSIAARDVFYVSPTPRRDLLPLYICRATDNAILYSLQQSCEGYTFNDGILGYIVSPATPGRCGTVPLYRLYDPLTVDRHYTTRADERDLLVERGYVVEPIAGYVWPRPTERCGPNGVVCAAANGTPSCIEGVCGVASCNDGFADCDGVAANGCEVNTRSSTAHCGACDNACATGNLCARGVCVPAMTVDAIGCADGTREAFTDRTAFPHIAACAGPWAVPGIFPAVPPSTAAACATLGNSSTSAPANGAGCASSNLCAVGWHVCNGGEVMPRTANAGCVATAFPSRTFFAASVSGPGCFRCALPSNTVTGDRCTNAACADNCRSSTCSLDCRESDDLNNDFFGCGTIGYGAPTACDGLDRTPGNNCEAVPGTTWRCEGPAAESITVTKVGSANGGVLCCRDGA